MTRLGDLLRPKPGRPMHCREVGQLLQHYLDGCVDSDRARRIADHLDECRRCGLDADSYQQIKASLGRQRIDVPADSVERLRRFSERLANGEETLD
jgi:anti-sigma factor RsiW